jgi:hypothetical protein
VTGRPPSKKSHQISKNKVQKIQEEVLQEKYSHREIEIKAI